MIKLIIRLKAQKLVSQYLSMKLERQAFKIELQIMSHKKAQRLVKTIKPDQASYRESIVNSAWAGLLTYNILPSFPSTNDSGYYWQNTRVTYSCATVRDSHTIPY